MRKLFLLFILPLQIQAQDLEKFVDSLLISGNRNDVPGTMVLVAVDGKPVFQKAYGMANLGLSVPLKTDHTVAIGSVAKQFTAVAILQLAEKGKLKLSDDIRKYLPGYNRQGQVITIENLLNHTSGISSTERPDMAKFRADNGVSFHHNEFLQFAGSSPLLFQPSTSWSYNNIAFMLAAIIVEKVSSQSFANYLRDQIFLPAGMTKTYLAHDLAPETNVVHSYFRTGNGEWRNADRDNFWGWEKGAGGIMSTMDDMLKWDIALREHKVLSSESLRKAWQPYILRSGQNTNYGLGWYTSSYPGYQIISHGGAVNAFRCNSIHIPEKKLYVFYIGMNGVDYNVIPKKIVSHLLGIPAPVPEKKAIAPVSDYAGSYQVHYAGSRLYLQSIKTPVYSYFSVSGDSLFLRQPFVEKTYLRPAGKDRFLPSRGEGGIYVFHRNDSGQITHFTMETFLFGGGATNIPNRKVSVASPSQAKIVPLPTDKLAKYAGTYYNPLIDSYLIVEVENGKIYGRRVNTPRFELLPVSNNQFVRSGIEEFKFRFTENKNHTPLVTITDYRSLEYKKIGF